MSMAHRSMWAGRSTSCVTAPSQIQPLETATEREDVAAGSTRCSPNRHDHQRENRLRLASSAGATRLPGRVSCQPPFSATRFVATPKVASHGGRPLVLLIIYIGVADVTATLQKVVARGGTIRYPRFEVPARVVLGMFKDPARNSVGLVEMEHGKAKVPK
jgi:hypothetical protein